MLDQAKDTRSAPPAFTEHGSRDAEPESQELRRLAPQQSELSLKLTATAVASKPAMVSAQPVVPESVPAGRSFAAGHSTVEEKPISYGQKSASSCQPPRSSSGLPTLLTGLTQTQRASVAAKG